VVLTGTFVSAATDSHTQEHGTALSSKQQQQQQQHITMQGFT
jgi:hypothetical protein